ncbi:nucleotidyltransferase domain-containing protein [Thermomicrobium sp. 4228-Ro]|uniref:nucleotidyltransferase domain-containing protein n=1 Tax=Thermomicrobium sp. 4228-Ro TaxID=2993937 RepID=UPI0022493406|nr:nucleotidyltransferase domain-containing protein [Thermomicrobium sp. 4228-Ro]MCX2728003.1 nucleotidyltransferase domain-containing protein [Thermomicrobium sp. 4228-Ro]
MSWGARIADETVEAWLAAAVERLVRELDPERILLFGSHARGTAGRRSDLDLIVVWDTQLEPLERIGRVLALLADAPRSVDVLVYTPAEFAERADLPFLRGVLREARVLYERGEAPA